MMGVLDHDLRERLKDIRAETLLIFGDEDRFTPLYQAKLLQAGIPGAVLRLIPGAGHAARPGESARCRPAGAGIIPRRACRTVRVA